MLDDRKSQVAATMLEADAVGLIAPAPSTSI
jgi:hypothetical protein